MTHDRREVETFDKALVVYLEAVGEGAEQPAGDSQYDAERGGWLLENIRGPLALVRNDGTIIWPVRDEHGDRVIPDEEEIVRSWSR